MLESIKKRKRFLMFLFCNLSLLLFVCGWGMWHEFLNNHVTGFLGWSISCILLTIFAFLYVLPIFIELRQQEKFLDNIKKYQEFYGIK